MLISTAWAQDAASAPGLAAQLYGFFPIILIFVVFYFLVLRPQNEEAKKHGKMVSALKKGDAVLTQGGMMGVISKVEEKLLLVKVAADTEVAVVKGQILRQLDAAETKAFEATLKKR